MIPSHQHSLHHLHHLHHLHRPRPAAPPVIHLQHCDCADCAPAARAPRRSMTIAEAVRTSLAGIATGNAIGFAIDPHAAWHALAGAAAQLLGR